MGEIADMLLEGTLDFYTGEYLGRGNGIPRTKNKSLDWEKRSKSNAYRGVHKYVFNRLGLRDCQDIVNEYLPGELKLKQKCVEIQKDFGAFIKFINQKVNPKQ